MNFGTIRKYGGSNSVGQWDRTDKVFLFNGNPVTWKGFSAFRLLNLFERGQDIRPYLSYFNDYNVARVWTSVTWNDGWDFPTNQATYDFLRFLRSLGYNVELTLCTDAREDRVDQAKALVSYLNNTNIDNLFLEAVNEPFIHDKLDPAKFKNLLTSTRFLYTSGVYTDTHKHYGKYWVDHSSRDYPSGVSKGGHNLYEGNVGGGPNDPSEPALRMPCVQDEPFKPTEFAYDYFAAYQYAASCVLLGAGATVHFESGKQCITPDQQELYWIDFFRSGLNVFPAGAWDGSYRRIVEDGQLDYARTYCTNRHSIRIKQKGNKHPEPGWFPLDAYGICWER